MSLSGRAIASISRRWMGARETALFEAELAKVPPQLPPQGQAPAQVPPPVPEPPTEPAQPLQP